MARIVQFIETFSDRGDGTKTPIRRCEELWTEDGRLVAYRDTHTGKSWYNPASLLTTAPPTHITPEEPKQ